MGSQPPVCLAQPPGLRLADKAGALSLLLLMSGPPIPPHMAMALLPSIAAVLHECAAAPSFVSTDDNESVRLWGLNVAVSPLFTVCCGWFELPP